MTFKTQKADARTHSLETPIRRVDGGTVMLAVFDGDDGMPAIALLNDGKELLGFMLVAGDAEFAPDTEYDCILTGVPKIAELLDNPLCRVIQDHKNTEFVVHVSGRPRVLTVSLLDGWCLSVSLGDEGAGSWSAEHADGTRLTGRCVMAGKDGGKGSAEK